MKSKKTRITTVRFSEEDWLAVANAAEAEGCTVGELVRRSCARAPSRPASPSLRSEWAAFAIAALSAFGDGTSKDAAEFAGDVADELIERLALVTP